VSGRAFRRLPAAGPDGSVAAMKAPGLALLAAVLAGCVTGGRKFDAAAHTRIEPGVTTRAEVDALLGRPEYVMQDAGRTLYRYAFEKVRPYGAGYGSATIEQRGLDVLFDEQGRVWKKLHSEGRVTVKEQMFGPASSLRPIAPEAVDGIRLGETTDAALRAQLGDPYWEYLTFDGWTVREWRHVYREGAFSNGRLRVLSVQFNDHGVVADFSFEEVPL